MKRRLDYADMPDAPAGSTGCQMYGPLTKMFWTSNKFLAQDQLAQLAQDIFLWLKTDNFNCLHSMSSSISTVPHPERRSACHVRPSECLESDDALMSRQKSPEKLSRPQKRRKRLQVLAAHRALIEKGRANEKAVKQSSLQSDVISKSSTCTGGGFCASRW